ncbi:MAG: 16S rRNA (uracil(1498)-N(3))-methyltransferase [Butyricicoccus sp.]|nr:16S rRNA (uracil(1498)-N(3))-methyltransferase [Butyricicoccus sp.]
MPRFFIDGTPSGERITLTGEDAHHLVKVLRMKPGESLTVCDSAGHDYLCTLEEAAKDAAVCRVDGVTASVGEPAARVTLYMGLPKGDKMDFIVQKAVELGAAEIVPFLAARSVSRPDAKTLQKKCERWRKIAREAAMQSGRGQVPAVGAPVSQAQAAVAAAGCDAALFLYENERETGIKAVLGGKSPRTVALMVGPEGGFAPEEAEAAVQAGMQSVSLGPRILRCETAPLAALAAVMYETGDL